MKSISSFIFVILFSLTFVGCASKLDEAKQLAKSEKFDLAIDKLREIPSSDHQWQEAQDLMKDYIKEKDKQVLSEALSLAKQSKIKESLSLIRTVDKPEIHQDVKQMKETIGKAIIQGSWEQIESGMGYTRIIRFDDGIFSVTDAFTNSNYRGTYEINRVSDAGELLSLDAQCRVQFGYQNFTIYLSIDFDELNRIHVEGNWDPPSNGTYARLNQ